MRMNQLQVVIDNNILNWTPTILTHTKTTEKKWKRSEKRAHRRKKKQRNKQKQQQANLQRNGKKRKEKTPIYQKTLICLVQFCSPLFIIIVLFLFFGFDSDGVF